MVPTSPIITAIDRLCWAAGSVTPCCHAFHVGQNAFASAGDTDAPVTRFLLFWKLNPGSTIADDAKKLDPSDVDTRVDQAKREMPALCAIRERLIRNR